jgi:fatty acid desaturase
VIAGRGEKRRRLHPQGHLGAAQARAQRGVLLFSLFPPAWLLGTAGLSVAKILENMEIGHNVLHGQWDWMRDPKIHSTTWEWDTPRRPSSGSTRTTSCTTRTPT